MPHSPIWLQKVACSYVNSELPVNIPLKVRSYDITY